ncbi:MAG: hypothetical protein L6Q71_02125, partial [Planctomycetes bacterium]|nr:hypothetical protein [Planctomycetota bacterium]
MPPTWILGFHQGHDAAVTLLRDGEPYFALAEERLSRAKHDVRFPARALELALDHAGIGLADLTAIASTPVDGAPDAVAPMLKLLLAEHAPGKNIPIHVVGHHLSHAASAYYPSGFDAALVFTFDGRGGPYRNGREAYCLWEGRGQELRCIWRQPDMMFSFGGFYGAMASAALGSNHLDFNENAGKGMGLAPFGVPGVVEVNGWTEDAIDARLDDFGDIEPETGEMRFKRRPLPYTYDLRGFRDNVYEDTRRIVESMVKLAPGDERLPKLVMYFAQRWFEKQLLTVVEHWTKKLNLRNVCLAGGCSLNSVANTNVAQLPNVDGLFVQSASGDAGTSFGAALLAANRLYGQPRMAVQVTDAYGRAWSNAEIEQQLKAEGAVYSRVEDPAQEAAKMLAEGKIVGWFEGRDEFGPRALGQRSILADPRRADIKDQLNSRVKFREGFRPFAPIAPAERVADWFEAGITPAWKALEFMLVVPRVRKDKAALIPGATHIDGSGRLQSVRRETLPHLHRVLTLFGELTGVPVLINTSFNLKGEPIVHSPKDAYDCFAESRIDALIAGPFVVTKKPADADERFEVARHSEQVYRAWANGDSDRQRELLAGNWVERIGRRQKSASMLAGALRQIGREQDAMRVALANVMESPDDEIIGQILYDLLPKFAKRDGLAFLREAAVRGEGSHYQFAAVYEEYIERGDQDGAREFL